MEHPRRELRATRSSRRNLCPTLDHLLVIRQMYIEHRDYKALRNNAPRYHEHVIGQFLIPLRHEIRQWRDNACRECRRSYQIWISEFEGKFDMMINGQIRLISLNFFLLTQLE